MRYLLSLIFVVLLVAGCSRTQSGVNKQYDMTMNLSGESAAILVVSLDADTRADTASGDAPADASVDPAVALGMQGSTTSAAAKGAEQLLEDIVSRVEAWQKSQDDNRKTNSDNTTTNTTNEAPPPITEEDIEPDTDTPGAGNPGPAPGEAIVTQCSGTMSYRDCEGCPSVEQIVCMFDQFNTCSDVPVDRFTLQFVDSSGNTREIAVNDKCGIAMGNEEQGFIKWRYEHDKAPFKPVGYAPRGFNAVEARILKQ